MSEVMGNPFELERVLDYVIALFEDEEEDPESADNHTHNESKLDQAIRLIEEGDKDLSGERVIKVVHCDDYQSGRAFNDRISIEFSPSELSSLKTFFEQQAVAACDYDMQTFLREQREAFNRAYEMWDGYKRDNK